MLASFNKFPNLETLRSVSGHANHSVGLMLYAFVYEAVKRRLDAQIVEIGVNFGYTTLYMLSAVHDAEGSNAKLISIDMLGDPDDYIGYRPLPANRLVKPYLHDGIEELLESIQGDTRSPHVRTLLDEKRRGRPIPCALIDGGHDYDIAINDLNMMHERMTDDAQLLVHDGHYAPVVKALDDFCAAHSDWTRALIGGCGELVLLTRRRQR